MCLVRSSLIMVAFTSLHKNFRGKTDVHSKALVLSHISVAKYIWEVYFGHISGPKYIWEVYFGCHRLVAVLQDYIGFGQKKILIL